MVQLCKALAKPWPQCAQIEQHERAWCKDVVEGRGAAFALYDDYPDRRDDFITQFLLVQVAAGLAFLNKRAKVGGGGGGLTPAQHRQAFIWSAMFLEGYLDLTGQMSRWVDFTTVVAPLPSVGQQTRVRHVVLSEEDWKKLGDFDARGSNILILDRGVRDDLELQDLLAAPWMLVLDLEEEEVPTALLDERANRVFRQLWPEGTCPRRRVVE